MFRHIWQAAFYFLGLAILVLSLLPIDHPEVASNDKVNHFIAYGLLTFLGCLAYGRRLLIVVGVIAFGALVEVLQGLTGYRFLSIADAIANALGAFLGWGVFVLFEALKPVIMRRFNQ